jgi:uncharacterized repeat protein (TIGR03803 family)
MQSQAQRLLPLFRVFVPAGITALLITSATLPMPAQNSVPATAVQAARMPQFASRLSHPGARPNPAAARPRSRGVAPQDGIVYDNGPINGNTNAWTINFGFVTSDTFTVGDGVTVTGMSFGAWLFLGDVLEAAEISITSQPNGGTTYFDQTVSITVSGCSSNGFGFNVCTTTGSFSGPVLQPGTYWVNLQNAVVSNGDPVYWDENDGPSQAYNSSVGTIPSEAFSLQGQSGCPPAQVKPVTAAKAVSVPRSPTQTYRVIYNFTGGADGGQPTSGLVIDTAGNLYGTTTSGGGPASGGTVFKLSPRAPGWTFSRLYLFTGPNGSYPDATLVRGADGRLYGTTAYGGMGQGNGNGVIFGLSPAGNILPTPFSNWMESLLYDFTGGNDGANPGGTLALDSSGNIYGSAVTGGANGGGTLYEFTNSGIQVLHSFPAFEGDGIGPIGVIKGANGLYGITASGSDPGTESGTVFTTAGGYHVLLGFLGAQLDSLTADQAGNLYYTVSSLQYDCQEYGEVDVDELSPSGGQSTLTSFEMRLSVLMSWVSMDVSGNIYGTVDYLGDSGNVYKLACCWNYTDLHDFAGGPGDGAYPGAAPVVDAQGNIYGTTQYGGTYGQGVVWEISP